MKKNVQKLLAGLLVLVMTVALTGFTVRSAATDEAGASPARDELRPDLDAAELEGLDIIGEETEDCLRVKLTNATGQDITAINIRPSDGDGVWSDDILAEEDRFEEDEAAVLCVEAGVYDLQFTFADWTVAMLHSMDVTDITEAELDRQWNGLPYLVYTSVSTGEEIDTSSIEQSIAEGEIAAGTFAYGGPTTSSGRGSGGGSSGGSGNNGGDTGCIGDSGLFW